MLNVSKNLTAVLARMAASKRFDEPQIQRLRDALEGKEPLRRSVSVTVERANGGKAPNGADYHVKIKASTDGVARDGGVITLESWEEGGLENFENNPVIQFAHDYSTPPIGRSVHTEISTKEHALIQYWEFHDEDDMSRLIHRLYDRGFMRAASVGFLIHEVYFPDDDEIERLQKKLGTRDDIYWVSTRTELLETSAVPVPSDAGALSYVEHAMSNGRAHGMNVDPLVRALSALTKEKDTMPKKRDASEQEPVAPVTEPQTDDTAEERGVEDEFDARAADTEVRALIASLQERIAALETARDAETDEGDEPEAEQVTEPVEGADGDDTRDGDASTATLLVEKLEGETDEEAVARHVDEIVRRKLGAPRA